MYLLKNFIFIFLCLFFFNLEAKIEKELLIVGCARSGTTYVAEVLEVCGLDVRHEAVGDYGVVSWLMTVSSHKTPFGPGDANYKFKHIFHQVRDPLSVISSVYHTEPQESWNYIMTYVPEIHENDSLIVKSVKYWIYWNIMAEKKAEWTYRLEDMEKALPIMGKKLDVVLVPEILLFISNKTNTRNRPANFTWADIKFSVSKKLYKKLRQVAEHYGY